MDIWGISHNANKYVEGLPNLGNPVLFWMCKYQKYSLMHILA